MLEVGFGSLLSAAAAERVGEKCLKRIIWKALVTFYSPEECVVYKTLETSGSDCLPVAKIAEEMLCEPYTNENITVLHALLELKGIVESFEEKLNTTTKLYEQSTETVENTQKWKINYKRAAETIFCRSMHLFYQNFSQLQRPGISAEEKHVDAESESWRCHFCETMVKPHEVSCLEVDDETSEFVCPVCPDTESGEKVLLQHTHAGENIDYQSLTGHSTSQMDSESTLELLHSCGNEKFQAELHPIVDILRSYAEAGPFYFPKQVSKHSQATYILSRKEYEDFQRKLKENADTQRKQSKAPESTYEDFRLLDQRAQSGNLTGTSSNIIEDYDVPPWFREAKSNVGDASNNVQLVFDFDRSLQTVSRME